MQQTDTRHSMNTYSGAERPIFSIGKHDSKRDEAYSELEYGHLLNQGISFATAPITNSHFKTRVFKLVRDHLDVLSQHGEGPTANVTSSRAEPVLLPLTPEDTSLFPSAAVSTFTACTSPWINLASPNPIIASISRQVLNMELNYANFCGVRSIMISGPVVGPKKGQSQGPAQYSRAVEEALTIGSRLNFLIRMPMYDEPQTGDRIVTLASLEGNTTESMEKGIDIYTSWDSWHHVQSVCKYNLRLGVALDLPRVMPERDLQSRWFSEPVHYLCIGPEVFQVNKAGFPSLSKHHQSLITDCMRLKNAPWILLSDCGPTTAGMKVGDSALLSGLITNIKQDDFPPLGSSPPAQTSSESSQRNTHVDYLKWLENQQTPFTFLDGPTMTSFQDWLQSPLQPLSDNLESATYEVFEGDPVKYNQYEVAVIEALKEWKELKKPTSKDGVVVIAVAGSGRGPLVTRALKAAEYAKVDVEVWAVEKNPNAYVYLLRQNQQVWGGKVKVIKTDMRSWKGPVVSEGPDGSVYGKVDILISELLGSFGDNELSPECLDGIQHVMAKPHGISIPSSYTAHFTPISTPKIHADILTRVPVEPTAFETPWVVHLYQYDYSAQRVPDHPRFQEAWEFSHPIPESTFKAIEARRSGGVIGGGGGSMMGAAGANDHNSRFCHLTFVCRTRGVTHGLAGYFESTLYESQVEANKGQKVEISTHPERIDAKSKDMISWFPIFFPLKQPLYFPADTELEVSMWRQTDDSKVWYEWLVEAWTWVGPQTRIKVGASELCSSRKVACLM